MGTPDNIRQGNRKRGRRARRRLGVCKGADRSHILDEILKGANVVIEGDSGKARIAMWSFSRSWLSWLEVPSHLRVSLLKKLASLCQRPNSN